MLSVRVSRLGFAYKNRPVLRDVGFAVPEHTMLCVLGPNGVGKSTLFGCILGLLTRFSGEVLIRGRDVRSMRPRELAREIAFVPQSHMPAFNLTALEMVLMGTSALIPPLSAPGKREAVLAMEAMERVGVQGLGGRGYMQLSGGEKQLVLIARALAQQARILILDEPTANLDYGNQLRVLRCARELVGDGYTVIQSTHSPDQAFLFADSVLALWEGTVAAFGPPGEIVDAGLIRQLYGVEVEICRLYGGRVSVCVPKFAVSDKE